MSYTIKEISNIIKARYVGDAPDVKILRLLTDSRSLSFPDETLFFAIVTRHGDGHNYVDELYKRGVRSFVVNTAFDCGRYPDAGGSYTYATKGSTEFAAIVPTAAGDYTVKAAMPSVRSGIETIAPSGKFWMAMPSARASAAVWLTPTWPDAQPA